MSKPIKISEMQKGHKFSELSHYTFIEPNPDGEGSIFEHHQTKELVVLQDDYVKNLLKSAEQYHTVVEVGKEDKYWTAKQIEKHLAQFAKGQVPDGETPVVGEIRQLGIRSIWENIHSKQVFTVAYKVASKEKVSELKERQLAGVENLINAHGKPKTAWNAATLKAYIEGIVLDAYKNPIVREPRERVLRGYKIQFASRTGLYDCVDMNRDVMNVRPVNINTLLWIVFDGVKYVVK